MCNAIALAMYMYSTSCGLGLETGHAHEVRVEESENDLVSSSEEVTESVCVDRSGEGEEGSEVVVGDGDASLQGEEPSAVQVEGEEGAVRGETVDRGDGCACVKRVEEGEAEVGRWSGSEVDVVLKSAWREEGEEVAETEVGCERRGEEGVVEEESDAAFWSPWLSEEHDLMIPGRSWRARSSGSQHWPGWPVACETAH